MPRPNVRPASKLAEYFPDMKSFAYGLMLAFALTAQSRAVNIDFITGGIITSNLTINVPSDYATLQAALTALSSHKALDTATVTIQIADGTYSFSSPLVIPRGVGGNLQIIGNVASPGSVILSFSGGSSGFVLVGNQFLNLINGMTIDGGSPATGSAGVGAYHSSSVTIGSATIIKNFNYGVTASLNSSVICNGITVASNTVGVASNTGSGVWANSVTATSNVNNGFYANYSGVIVALSSTVTGSPSAYFADTGGNVVH